MFYKAFHLCNGVRDLNLFDPCCFSGVCKGVARGVASPKFVAHCVGTENVGMEKCYTFIPSLQRFFKG